MKTHRTGLSAFAIIQMLLIIIVVPLLPLLISWDWKWWEAWVYASICIFGFAISRLLAAKRHPDIIAERARFMRHENTIPWDKTLAPLLGLGGGLIPLFAGLDERFDWSPTFNLPLKIISLVIILVGYIIGSYALIVNRFFSGMVRIQTDRNHHVVSSGPYRWVRHPGYAGALMTYLVTPVFLDAIWVYIPVFFVTIVLVIRTELEDKALKVYLEGYDAYTEETPYRLIPGIW